MKRNEIKAIDCGPLCIRHHNATCIGARGGDPQLFDFGLSPAFADKAPPHYVGVCMLVDPRDATNPRIAKYFISYPSKRLILVQVCHISHIGEEEKIHVNCICTYKLNKRSESEYILKFKTLNRKKNRGMVKGSSMWQKLISFACRYF